MSYNRISNFNGEIVTTIKNPKNDNGQVINYPNLLEFDGETSNIVDYSQNKNSTNVYKISDNEKLTGQFPDAITIDYRENCTFTYSWNSNSFLVTNNLIIAKGFQYFYLVSSTDGISWNKFIIPSDGGAGHFDFDIKSITYFNDKYYAVSTNLLFKSDDGVNWTITDIISGGDINNYVIEKIKQSGSLLFLFMYDNINIYSQIRTSVDGINWSTLNISLIMGDYIYDVAWNGTIWCMILTKFVGVPGQYNIKPITSSDGENWTVQDSFYILPSGVNVSNINIDVISNRFCVSWYLYNPFHLYETLSGNRMATSVDGINWTLSLNTNMYCSNITNDGSKFYFIGHASESLLYSSVDGINWNTTSLNIQILCRNLYVFKGKLIAFIDGSNAVLISNDAITWEKYNINVSPNFAGIVKCFSSVMYNTNFIITDDCYFRGFIGDINTGFKTFNNIVDSIIDIFVVNNSVNVYNATDNIIHYNKYLSTLTIYNIATNTYTMPIVDYPNLTTGFSSMSYSGSIYVLIVNAVTTDYYTSTNLSSWTKRSLPVSKHWKSISWNGTAFCVVGYNTNIALTSTNGTSWTQRTLPATANWCIVVPFAGGYSTSLYRFMAVVYNSNTYAISAANDGASWSQGSLTISGNWSFGYSIFDHIFFIDNLTIVDCFFIGSTLTSISQNLTTIINDIYDNYELNSNYNERYSKITKITSAVQSQLGDSSYNTLFIGDGSIIQYDPVNNYLNSKNVNLFNININYNFKYLYKINNLYVCIGNGYDLASSHDGINWSIFENSISINTNCVSLYHNGDINSLTGNQRIKITYYQNTMRGYTEQTSITIPATTNYVDFIYAAGEFNCYCILRSGATTNNLIYSSDLVNFTGININDTTLTAMAYGKNSVVIISATKIWIWTRKNRSLVSFSPVINYMTMSAIAWNGEYFIITIKGTNRIMVTINGYMSRRLTLPISDNWKKIKTVGERVYILGDSYLIYSDDLINWEFIGGISSFINVNDFLVDGDKIIFTPNAQIIKGSISTNNFVLHSPFTKNQSYRLTG